MSIVLLMDFILNQEEFNFKDRYIEKNNSEIELPASSHVDECRARIIFCACFFIITFLAIFLNINPIVSLLQSVVKGIRFFQSSPGEYFFSTIKIAFYFGALSFIPVLVSQVLIFFVPGLKVGEKEIALPLITGSVLLFALGLVFCYFILIPAALKFFINYSSDLIEPLWSFEEYFSFILNLMLSTGLGFQLPVIQITLGITKIITVEDMQKNWRPILIGCTILGAILTPSTDPTTQVMLSGSLFALYGGSLALLEIFNKRIQTVSST